MSTCDQPVGFRINRILTDYAQKTSRALGIMTSGLSSFLPTFLEAAAAYKSPRTLGGGEVWQIGNASAVPLVREHGPPSSPRVLQNDVALQHLPYLVFHYNSLPMLFPSFLSLLMNPNLLNTYWCGSPLDGVYQHRLLPMALTGQTNSNMVPSGRRRSLVIHNSKCGNAIRQSSSCEHPSHPPLRFGWKHTFYFKYLYLLPKPKIMKKERGGGGEEEDLKYTWDFFPTWEFEFLVMRLSQVCQTLELLDFKCSYLRLNIHIDVF